MKYPHARPWRVVQEQPDDLPLLVSQNQPGYICQCYDDEGNARQNADLIAEAVSQHRDYRDFVQELARLAVQYPDRVTAEWLIHKVDSFKMLLSYP